MNKYMKIDIVDDHNNRQYLNENECNNIINRVSNILGEEITEECIIDLLDVLITRFAKNKSKCLYVNIDRRNRELEPVKEMTLEDVEKELGYKVRIVNDK